MGHHQVIYSQPSGEVGRGLGILGSAKWRGSHGSELGVVCPLFTVPEFQWSVPIWKTATKTLTFDGRLAYGKHLCVRDSCWCYDVIRYFPSRPPEHLKKARLHLWQSQGGRRSQCICFQGAGSGGCWCSASLMQPRTQAQGTGLPTFRASLAWPRKSVTSIAMG